MKGRTVRSGWMIFRWPLLLAATTIVGLLSALLGDGWADMVSCGLLASVLVTVLVSYCRHGPASA